MATILLAAIQTILPFAQSQQWPLRLGMCVSFSYFLLDFLIAIALQFPIHIANPNDFVSIQ